MKTALHNLTLFIMVILSTTWLGCAQKDKGTKIPIEAEAEKQATTNNSKYDKYLLLMDDEQRASFFKLDSDLKRDRFLQAQGIKRKKFLKDKLILGMSQKDVNKILGNPNITDTDIYNNETQWIYTEFNNYRTMQYVLVFQDDSLTKWKLQLY